MISERKGDAVLVRAPAKVNLFLEILGKRPDGYHEIATLMVAVSLYDRLEFTEERSGRLDLHCDEPSLSAGPDNLVWRAAELLRQRYGVSRGARIQLGKRIPLAAGLAGGSSDAAAALTGLNELWQLGLSRIELAARAAELGSDVAFFFATPAAWCTGRGEIVAPCPIGRTLQLLLVCPEAGLATAAVYRGVRVPAEPLDGVAIRQALAAGDLEKLGGTLHNRLQPAAEKLCPEVADLFAELGTTASLGRLMSGSGSSLFALCRNRSEAVVVARRLRQSLGWQKSALPAGRGLRLFLVRSCV
jgi:4-diphosphocytidyl-2-C-methyl-D-erythritol kinase